LDVSIVGHIVRVEWMPENPVQFNTVKYAAEKCAETVCVRITEPFCATLPAVTFIVRKIPCISDST
jgi:hypothetical protein